MYINTHTHTYIRTSTSSVITKPFCPLGPCAINGDYFPKNEADRTNSWIGLGSINYLIGTIAPDNKQDDFLTSDEIRSFGEKYVVGAADVDFTIPFMENYGFSSTYVSEMMKLMDIPDMKKSSGDWTIGALMYDYFNPEKRITASAGAGTGGNFAVTCEASSSKIKYHVYNTTDIYNIQSISLKPLPDNLDTSAVSPGESFEDLKKRLEAYETHIGSLNIPGLDGNAPVSFKATAGIRSVHEGYTEMFDKLNVFYSEQGDTLFKGEGAEIISGPEEAKYGWIAMNQESFRNGDDDVQFMNVMDYGGSSLQTSIEGDTIVNDEFTLYMGDTSYSLFAKSYHGFGQDDAIQRALELCKFDDSGDSGDSEAKKLFPCIPLGLEKTYGHVPVVGTGDVEACKKLVNDILVPMEFVKN